jgi:chlorite dismutase
MRHPIAVLILCLLTSVAAGSASAADREKLLSEPGVYGTFAVFQMDQEWWKLDKAARMAALTEVKAALKKHGERLAIDAYLLRGLYERGDFFLRVHSTELTQTQDFLLELMGTTAGRYMKNTVTLNGITKKLNYVPAFSDEVKAALKTPLDPGLKPYAIVIPIRKDAAWWLTDQEGRTARMKEHTEASIPYLKTVKRKLYHASGLDDVDFLTYFETAKLDDFNNLVIALERVQENRHNAQFGRPTILGTIRPIEDILEVLAR